MRMREELFAMKNIQEIGGSENLSRMEKSLRRNGGSDWRGGGE
jgi:hypothetical protein